MFYLVELFIICATVMLIDTAMTKPGIPDSGKEQRMINIFTVGLLIYFAGFRSMGGTDFDVYGRIYINAPESIHEFFAKYDSLHNNFYLYGADKGYIFINTVLKQIGFTYFGYNFIHSLFCIGVIYFCTRKYTNNYSIVILVILYKMFFYDFFISLRQTVTIAVFFLMIKDIEGRHPVRYFLLCLLCYWIHAASIVLFAVYFVRYLKLSKNTIILLNVIFIPTLFLSIFNVPVLRVFDAVLEWDIFGSERILDKATGLIEGSAEEGINWLHTIEYFVIMLLLIHFFDDIKAEFPNSEMMIKLFLCLLPIFTLFRNYEILTRWKDYFTISYGFILSYMAGIRCRKYRYAVMLFTVLWVGFGYFRFITLFEDGAFMEEYFPIRGYVTFFER